MDIKEVSSNSLSFIGDAVYTLNVRKYFVESGFQASNKLQYLCNKCNSAKGSAGNSDKTSRYSDNPTYPVPPSPRNRSRCNYKHPLCRYPYQ